MRPKDIYHVKFSNIITFFWGHLLPQCVSQTEDLRLEDIFGEYWSAHLFKHVFKPYTPLFFPTTENSLGPLELIGHRRRFHQEYPRDLQWSREANAFHRFQDSTRV